jgi:TolA-binding protein
MRLHHWLCGAALAVMVVPVSAQDSNVEGRVGKLEKEMKAVQRKVFPDGASKFFEPEIKPDEVQKGDAATSSTSAVTDLIARVDALETQLATLTGQVEQQGTKMRSLESQLKSLDAQMKALKTEEVPVGTNGAAVEKPIIAPVVAKPATTVIKPATAGTKPAPAVKPSASRTAAVAAIQKPASGDGFADGYDYGYRLWEAKFYPEAQTHLDEIVKKYPKHKRISFARNLLGRAWLDEGKPATAVKILYDNYTSQPEGERAPESLYFVGVALNQLGKAAEACKAFESVDKEYPDAAKNRLAARLVEGRKKAKCK